MQSKLEQRTDFHNKIYNNPINLLKGIKQHALDYQETKYAMEVIDNALVHFLLMKQREELLYDYVRKFKTAKEVLESHVGDPIILTKTSKSSEDYDETELSNYKDLKEQAWEQVCAYKFLKNANKQKYGQILEHLRERKSIGKDEFPNTLIKAINIFIYYNVQNKNTETNNIANKSINDNANDTRDEEIMPKFTFMTLEYKCFVCGKAGYKSPQCRYRNAIPKSQWAIKQATNDFNQEKQDNNSDVSTLFSRVSTKTDKDSTQSKKKIGW